MATTRLMPLHVGKGKGKRINCYDFQNNEIRQNQSIVNCAHENGFLNFDIKKYIELINSENVKVNKPDLISLAEIILDNPRFVDDFLTKDIEPLLNDVFSICKKYYVRNVLANYDELLQLTLQQKYNISKYMAYQYLRTRAFREYLLNIAFQNNYSKKQYESYSKELMKEIEALIHIKFLIEHNLIEEMTNLICNCTWTVLINNTKQPFITSDNPVGVVRDSTKFDNHFFNGIELIAFPINSEMLLALWNPNKNFTGEKNRYVYAIESGVKYFNKMQTLNCHRNIFGNDLNTLQYYGEHYSSVRKETLYKKNSILLKL